MKKNVLRVAMALLAHLSAFGQNPNWLIGNTKTVNGYFPFALPIPSFDYGNTTMPNFGNQNMGYQGQLATNASNMITDASGGILFFIVDHHIYNKQGYCLGILSSTSDPYSTNAAAAVRGASEIVIVPNPSNCQQYYIISTRVNVNSYEKVPFVFLLDMSLPNYQAQVFDSPDCVKGELVPIGSNNGISQNVGIEISTLCMGSEGTPLFIDPNDPSPGKSSNVFIGASNKNSTNEHFVFISNPKFIFRFKISSTGFTFDNYAISLPTGPLDYNAASVRSELEIIELANGNYRIACPYFKSQTIGSNTAWEWLYTAELNSSGSLIPSTDHHFPFFKDPNSQTAYTDAALKGLEFSGDGTILYVTHSTNSVQPNQLEYFNFNNPTASLVPLAINPSIDAKFSLLERDINNAIYFTGNTGMYKLNNSNTPSAALVQVTSTPGVYNLENNGSTGFFSDLYKLYMLPDQIDKMDYNAYLQQNLECCLANTTFDKDAFTAATGILSWNGGNNPLNNNSGNTVTIKRELRIPAGSNLTITDMNIQFAPGARLVIENANTQGQQGGRLTLKGTTLTAANLCGTGSMWLGVEVWGNKTLPQGSLGNSTQGRLIMMNSATTSSKIEHAQIGILVSKRPEYFLPGDECQSFPLVSTTGFDNNRNGGIISLTNAKIINNTTGIYFRPYVAPSLTVNKSSINRSDLIWDDNYRGNTLNYHVYLMRVKGISLQADNFYNNITSAGITALFNQGIGVYSDNANFSVLSICNTTAPPPVGGSCANYTRSTFKNLKVGVTAINLNNFTFQINRCDFTNCQGGVVSLITNNQRITENNFYTREISTTSSNPTDYGSGIVLNKAKGYKIEENMFTETNALNVPSETYGVYLISSGTLHNEVYKNLFYSLRVGGKSDLINGSTVPVVGPVTISTTGLQYICNTFRYPIAKTDIFVNKGPIDYHQGYIVTSGTVAQARNAAARNIFSLFNENQTLLDDHDITVIDPQPISYVYLNSSVQNPDNVSPNVSTTLQTILNPYTVISPSQSMCPSKLNVLTPTLNVVNLFNKKNELEQIIDGGNSSDLKEELLVSNLPYSVVSPYSPYLSDDILISFLASSATNEQKRIILSAQTPLPSAVKENILNSSLPQPIKHELLRTTGDSPMEKLSIEISQAASAFQAAFNNKLSELYLDSAATNEDIVDFLSDFETVEAKKELTKYYVSIGDSLNAFNLMGSLYADHAEFVKVCNALFKIEKYDNLESALTQDPTIVSTLENLALNSCDNDVKMTAEQMLSVRGAYTDLPPMNADESSKMHTEPQVYVHSSAAHLLKLYPNPTSGILNFTTTIELPLIHLSIVDMNGRAVYSAEFSDVAAGQVDLSHLKQGVYLVQYTLNDSVTETQRITID